MPGVYSVFNIGTGHAQNEPNNTIASLGRDCLDWYDVTINDGPGSSWFDGLGKAFGMGMDSTCSATVKDILARKPSRVNMAGHSRGGVLCHMIANDLAEKGFNQRINMVVLDPVNMSPHVQRAKEIRGNVNLGCYVAIVMENVTVSTFPLTRVQPMSRTFEEHMHVLNMPGTHGSGTQCKTSAIGKAVRATIGFLMNAWGTNFGETVTLPDILEAYAEIHEDSPVTYDAHGLVTKRQISDDKKGFGRQKDITVKDQGLEQRRQQIGDMVMSSKWETGSSRDFRDTPYFINEFHATAFKAWFPALYARFAGDKDWWQHESSKPEHLRHLQEEIRLIDGGDYPKTRRSLQQLGMID